jgi:hypothetical protein
MDALNGFDMITCRLAIQVCIGYSPSGRARHRTFSIKGIKPDVDLSVLAAFVRDVIAPILAFPVTKVRLVTKKTYLFAREETAAEPVTDSCPSKPAKPRRFAQKICLPLALRSTIRFLRERAASFLANLVKLLKRSFVNGVRSIFSEIMTLFPCFPVT